MSTKAPFTLLTAFSNQFQGGNPAVVAFLDINLPTTTLHTIARTLGQPIASFVSSTPLPSKDEKTVAFGIRWFTTSDFEVPLCGHGTIAAAKAVFERSDLVTDAVDTIEFHTLTYGIMTARKVEGGLFEIKLPSGRQVEITGDERAGIHERVVRMFGKEDLAINYIGKGVDNFDHCLLIELDEKEDLKGCRPNAQALSGNGFSINIVTTASTSGKEVFVSRMFAPGFVTGDEDHVCGSAHCVLVPYWSKKLNIARGNEIKATQVSRRGGDLKVVWDSEEDIVTLRGEVTILANGELCLP
ncbi:hypothetical protein BDZ94DRAFT_1151766 [Collybia nuda]|uniref:Diaminopimelate epimerase-like protein n=1 Tax=Collybia nuda TaxID=64659 RepID=A0A9P6CKL3_9AGAR|nr:hypothetical protein BDZ94DRAFT_1151766 [Collybia nuda]